MWSASTKPASLAVSIYPEKTFISILSGSGSSPTGARGMVKLPGVWSGNVYDHLPGVEMLHRIVERLVAQQVRLLTSSVVMETCKSEAVKVHRFNFGER
jgi:hypothetical protein